MKILYYTGWLITRIVSKLVFRINIEGQENIPKTGGFILASNHISHYDPPLVGSWATRQVYFLAKKELFKSPLFGWIITRTNALPVKRGTIDRTALDMCAQVIQRGFGMTIFPEGTRSKTEAFLDPKPGIGIIAIKAGCPIVPAFINGSNYPKDCFWGRERLSITYGKPLSSEWVRSFEQGKEGYFRLAAAVMEQIGNLRQQVKSRSST